MNASNHTLPDLQDAQAFWDMFRDLLFKRGPLFLQHLLVAALILFATFFLARAASRSARHLLQSNRNTHSLAQAVSTLVKVSIWALGIVTALSEIGLNVSTLLAGAGVLGLAIGFGAQALVKDLLSGFFLIFDDVLRVGDSVRLDGDIEGEIESIGLRMTQVRHFTGRLWYVPNGSITVVGNATRDWGRAVVDMTIAYKADFQRALILLKEVGDAFVSENRKNTLEAAEVQGILGFKESALTLRLAIKMRIPHQGAAERELRIRIKDAFDHAGIEMPQPILATRN